MKDETKEINIKIPGQILDYVDTKEHLLELFNYITNLQEKNKELKKKITFNEKCRRKMEQSLMKQIQQLQEERKTLYRYTPEKGFRLVGDDNGND